MSDRKHPTPWIFGRVCFDFYVPREALHSDEEADDAEETLYTAVEQMIRERFPAAVLDWTQEHGTLCSVSIEYGRDMGEPGDAPRAPATRGQG